MIDLDNIVRKIKDFPTLPTIYTTLLDVMANPKATASDIASVISKDQASSAKILKVANSSIFGLQNRINTITQAVVYIGFNEVKNIVIALSIMDMFSGVKATNQINPLDLWKHSLAVGVQTRLMGKTIGVQKFENYFLAGILHDLGKLLMLKAFPYEYAETYQYAIDNKIPLRQAEQEKMSFTSSLAGSILAEKWKLPLYVINTIKGSNTGRADGQLDTLVACVHLSDIVASAYGLSVKPNEMIQKPNEDIWEAINLPENYFAENEQRFLTDYEQMAQLMLSY